MIECNECQALGNMPSTKNDKIIAMQAAHGLGIADKDITYIENWTIGQIERTID